MQDYNYYIFFTYAPKVFHKVHVRKDRDLDPKDSQKTK
jgi:hypothetical protein